MTEPGTTKRGKTGRNRTGRETEAVRDAMDAAAVLAFRLPMLAMSPTPARQREARRMVEEKTEALVDGTMAWQRYWMTAWMRPVGTDHVAGAADAFAAPGRKTLRANAKRLSRRRSL